MKNWFFALLLISASCFGQGYKPIQVEARPWVKNNPDVPWKNFETRIVANLNNFKPVDRFDVNQYGSNPAKKFKATGFFRVEKSGERWWMVDPKGYAHIERAVVGLRQGPSDKNKAAFDKKFGTIDKWVSQTADDYYSFGFNGIAAWSDNDLAINYNKTSTKKLTYSPIYSFMASYGHKRGGTYQLPGNIGFPNQCIFVFDPEFETFCDEFAKQLAQFKTDPNLVGYFSDNELPFGLKNLEGYLTLSNPSDPGRLAAEAWLKSKGVTAAQINDTLRAEFAGVVAEKYFSTVAKAIRKYDPNHMYFGSRLHGSAKFVKEIMEAAGRHCDVVAINYYGDWTPSVKAMKNWALWAGKPFIITEFYTKGMDSGLANTTGAGFTVHTQQDRGYAYQHFCLGLLESGNCVGWDWFKYQDNDPTAKGVDPSNVDSNKGIVNNDYDYYQPLVNLMKELNINVYRLVNYFDQQK